MSQRPPENPVARQLHIKFGVVQRTQKELSAYHAELASNRAKVESMRASGADEFDIKKQVEVLGETEVMIPDTMRRLAKGIDDLRSFIEGNGSDSAISNSPQLIEARAVIAAAGVMEAGAEEDEAPI